MTNTEARNEINAMLWSAIKANVSIIGVSDPASLQWWWPGMFQPDTPLPGGQYAGRSELTTVKEQQSSLRKTDGTSRYEGTLQLLVIIHSPLSVPGSAENGRVFAEALRNAFRAASPSGELSLTQQMVRDVGNNATHYLTHVYAYAGYTDFQ